MKKETVAKGNLQLEVADFGPIAKAKVDLRPLTVFVGAEQYGQILSGNPDLCAASVFCQWSVTQELERKHSFGATHIARGCG